jgi:PKHD-type hydroxylase
MFAVHHEPEALSPADCARIAELAAGGGPALWLDDRPGAGWVSDRLIGILRAANRAVFGFDLREFAESPLLLRQEAGGRPAAQQLRAGRLVPQRKLATALIVAPAAGEGAGAIEVLTPDGPVPALQGQGEAILFPAFFALRLRPVAAGFRLTLHFWAHGPAFR